MCGASDLLLMSPRCHIRQRASRCQVWTLREDLLQSVRQSWSCLQQKHVAFWSGKGEERERKKNLFSFHGRWEPTKWLSPLFFLSPTSFVIIYPASCWRGVATRYRNTRHKSGLPFPILYLGIFYSSLLFCWRSYARRCKLHPSRTRE